MNEVESPACTDRLTEEGIEVSDYPEIVRSVAKGLSMSAIACDTITVAPWHRRFVCMDVRFRDGLGDDGETGKGYGHGTS